ncbi:hypothetical protein ABPG72_001450 [Tetrahymena utriculariae]
MGAKKNDNKEKNKSKKEKNQDEEIEEQKGRQNKRKEKRHKQKNWQDSDEFTKHLKEFNDEVSKYNLYIKDVQGDGSCLFRSVADQLEGDENMHMYYRKIAVNQLKKQEDFFKNFVYDIDFDQYLHEMNQLGAWGGNLEIQALSAALGHNFIIHLKGKPYLVIKGQAVKAIQKKTIHLAYHSEEDIAEHYSSIRNIGDEEQNMPAQPIKNEVFKLLEKEMNKDECKEQNDIQDNQSQKNDEEINQVELENKDMKQNESKKIKQSKIEIAKLKKEKAKQQKAERQINNQKKEKTQKSKQQQAQDNQELEADDNNDHDDSDEFDNQENSNNECQSLQENTFEQNDNVNQETIKRKEEKKIKDMVQKLATMQIQEETSINKIEGQSKLIKLGRNQKCHCGSLKPYKKCCESKDQISNEQKAKKNQDKLDIIKDVVFI